MTSSVHKSFLKTKKSVNEHEHYPRQPGIYALFLADKADLADFGQSGRLIYIGIAKESLQDRDFAQHFRSGQTGRSTVRRSLGAILRNKLRLTVIPRGGTSDSKRFDNYKFTNPGEQELTKWMVNNLEIGYWIPDRQLTYPELREEEKKITIELKPTLDLDPRTRRYNPFTDTLSDLRKICRTEAKTCATCSSPKSKKTKTLKIKSKPQEPETITIVLIVNGEEHELQVSDGERVHIELE